jgi:hypothetical protein
VGTLFEILTEYLAHFGPCYNQLVEIVNFPNQGFQTVGASGPCPHCGDKSYFKPVTAPFSEVRSSEQIVCVGAECESCKNFVLIVGTRTTGYGPAAYSLRYFYPLGRPRDAVDPSVPTPIGEDFKEALRCRWIEAYKATVTMCRRVIQASCLEKKADKKKKLVGQIDELAANGVITSPLKDFAHEVRLEGNDGAHPDADGLENVTQKDADDIIEFTREYLHHVYVMPAKLAARKAAPSGAAASSSKP